VRGIGNPSDVRYQKAMEGHGEYCETVHSMQKRDKTCQNTMHTLRGKQMRDNAPLLVAGHVIKLSARHHDELLSMPMAPVAR
jgi:hypothetical protein